MVLVDYCETNCFLFGTSPVLSLILGVKNVSLRSIFLVYFPVIFFVLSLPNSEELYIPT